MMRIILYVITGIITSCYYFPIGFTFLPPSINTKMLLAITGVAIFGYDTLKGQSLVVYKEVLIATGFAVFFSLICFITTDLNYTSDFSYATYFVSFFTWLGSAYTVCALIRAIHGVANFKLLTIYLAAVCLAQCVLAIVIDNVYSFQIFVDRYIDQGQAFFTEVNRLYGIGAALDNAGVRFSLVLIMIPALLNTDEEIRNDKRMIIFLLIAFFTTTVIGNVISRTTILGVIGGLSYFLFSIGLLRLTIQLKYTRLYLIFGSILLISIGVSTYLYYNNVAFHSHLRFAFEGFFNWAEKGEWRTDSTDKLNKIMWIWPNDMKTWTIGSGLFDNWVYGTDIGYCRFILYCGISGFMVFALFFVYNAIVFANIYKEYEYLFLIFLVLTFAIWIKVSTDIFLIYALFYSLDRAKPVHLLKNFA